jgi:hypothetical protein
VYLALPRAGLLNCVFMWAYFRVLTLSPLSVKLMQPYSDPFSIAAATPKRGRKPVVTPARVQLICQMLARGESERAARRRSSSWPDAFEIIPGFWPAKISPTGHAPILR